MIVCSQCGRESPDEERFCASCGTALAPALRREERKVVSIVFVDLVGSTARAERLDPEDVRALLSSYHARVRRELEGHGGTVEKFIGDAVVAVFGAPTAHEDDPERAVRAALAIHEAIEELNEAEPALELEVRIGVNTGEVLVALEARPDSGEGMVSGDVINTAARLQSAAPPGGILVGQQTHRATERAIDYAEHDPVDAKGKAEPVIAWRALRRRASFGVEQGAVVRAPLVGRDRELALLSDALARVRNDERPQLITLVGVPGIGKSRLVHELWEIVNADTDLITWRRGRSLPYGEGVAYWALGEIVKAQAGILESDGADIAAEKLARAVGDLLPEHTEAVWVDRQLRPLVGLPGADGQPSRDEAFAARGRFLEALAEQRPAVLIFEDLHWADDDLLDFVDELTDRLDAVPLLLVCTARPELLARRPGWGGGKLNALTLSLAPLSDDETARLLQALLDRSVLPAETQAALIRRSEGVPLFAEEYARMLESGDTGIELPENLQGIVAARIDGLPAADKAVLQDAAVLGKVFWTDALATSSGIGSTALEDCLRRLERQEFVRRERRSAVEGARQYVFLHALVRDAAYGQIPRAVRSDKHRRAAEWIAALPADRAEDRAEMLAFHLESAIAYGEASGTQIDDLRPLAVAALRDAGERAWGLSLASRAFQLYERALEMNPGVAPDPELLLRHAEATSWGVGIEVDPAPQLRQAIDALVAAGRSELAAIVMLLLERQLWRIGEPDAMLLDRALELVADAGPTPERGRVLAMVAGRRAIIGIGSVDETRQLAAEAVEIARAHRDRASETEALNNLALAHSNGGDTRAALDTGRRALELALECGASDVVRCFNNLATYEVDAGQLDAAARHHREGLEFAVRLGHKALAQHLEVEVVLDAFVRGAWDDLDAGFELGRARREVGTPHRMDRPLRIAELTVELCREGHLNVDDLRDVLEAARLVGDQQVLIPTVGDAVDLFATAGFVREADGLLDEFHDLARVSPFPAGWWSVAVARVWIELRNEPVPVEIGRSTGLPWADAVDLLRRGDPVAAADVLARIGARVSEAPVRFHAAQALVGSDPEEADRQLELACAFWRSVGATARLAYADEVRAKLRPAAS